MTEPVVARSLGGRRTTAVGMAVIVLGGCIWWGIHPPRTEQSYRQQSADTVELLRSDVQTASLWLAARHAGKVTTPAIEVALSQTEGDATNQLAGYSAYQPPNQAASDVRAAVTAAARRVVTVLGEVRIDARAGRWDDATGARADLVALSQRLDELGRRVAP